MHVAIKCYFACRSALHRHESHLTENLAVWRSPLGLRTAEELHLQLRRLRRHGDMPHSPCWTRAEGSRFVLPYSLSLSEASLDSLFQEIARDGGTADHTQQQRTTHARRLSLFPLVFQQSKGVDE